MTPKAAELREALDRFQLLTQKNPTNLVIADAARTIALPLLEQEPELVERIAAILASWDRRHRTNRGIAKEILAVITTPEAD